MTEATLTPTKTIDERGKICPYPDVDTMTTLKKMQKGEILEVLLDYPLSVERIPRSAEKNGHKVLSITQVDGPSHSILIEVLGNK
jgi:tRNA 2-thiouridine synthesizing protein A